jgi:hypothetical protein
VNSGDGDDRKVVVVVVVVVAVVVVMVVVVGKSFIGRESFGGGLWGVR